MRRLILGLIALSACAAEPLGERVIEVRLGYSDRTNTGPETARGVAIIDTFSDAVVLELSGFGEPADDTRHEVWLAGGGEIPRSLGRFNADGIGGASLAKTIENLSASTFSRVDVSLEPEPDPSPDPSVRIVISGDIE